MIRAQLALLLILFVWIAIYFLFLKSELRNRLILSLFVVFAVVGIMNPKLLDLAAGMLSIGRGVDLVLYMALFAGFFATMALYGRVARLEADRTLLVRQIALLEAELRQEPPQSP